MGCAEHHGLYLRGDKTCVCHGLERNTVVILSQTRTPNSFYSRLSETLARRIQEGEDMFHGLSDRSQTANVNPIARRVAAP